jgi:hypothetical protein
MQFRLIAGSHVGPDSNGVMRQWTAKGGHDIIDTNQDLNSLNVRGFPPKFQPLTASPTDEAALITQKAEIEARLAQIERDKNGRTPNSGVALHVGPPLAPPAMIDPRESVSPAAAAMAAKHTAAQAVLEACERMNDQELREFCEGEEIDIVEAESRADMMAAVTRIYA